VVSWTNNVDTQVEMLSIPTVTHNAIGLVVRRPTSLPSSWLTLTSRDRRGKRTRRVQLRALTDYRPASEAQHEVCQCRHRYPALMVRLLNRPCSLHAHDSGVPRGPGLMQVSLTDALRMLIRACTYEGVRKRGRHTTTGYEVNNIPSQTQVHDTVFVN
jgi:hypothetical protein